MSELFTYSRTFILDKAHFIECFEQSVTLDKSINAYRKALVFVIVGMLALLFSELDRYLASFIVGLGVVEALSVKYQQAWWVTRQLLGRSANNQVTITVDERGVTTKSELVDFTLAWQSIDKVSRTASGVILHVGGQKHYISASVLSEQALEFIMTNTLDSASDSASVNAEP